MKHKIYLGITILFCCIATTSIYAVDFKTYYASAVGKKKSDLKTAMHNIIKDADVLSYGSGTNATWAGFYDVDQMPHKECRDRYSDDHHYFTSRGSAVSGMNIEHSFPKSWWGGGKNQAYCDIHHLMPSESTINSRKSNYGMGVVTDQSYSNGCTKIGKGKGENGKTINLWEPADKWKGDFARAVFYMVTCYSNLNWQGTEALNSLEKNEWPTLKQWAYELYLQWNKEDPVDSMETARNEAVYKIQGNRNPFIDFPNLAEFVWGDSINVAFYIEKDTTQRPPTPPTPVDSVVLLSQRFINGKGDFTINNVSLPTQLTDVWTEDSRYGMKATAYGTKAYASESWLISPLVSCGTGTVKLNMNHALNKLNGSQPLDYLGVYYSSDKTNWTPIDISQWPAGTNWTYLDATATMENIGDVYFGFKYTSDETIACTWEILSMSVVANKVDTHTVASPAISFDELTRTVTIIPTETSHTVYYTTDGTIPTAKAKTYTVPFTIDRTTTVKAVSVDNSGATSNVTTLECTVVSTYYTIEELQLECSPVAKQAIFHMEDVVVTGVNTDYVFIQDDTGAFLLYGQSSNLTKGDVISGQVQGSLYSFNGLSELAITDQWGNVEQTHETTVSPRSIDPLEVTSDESCQYVTISGLEYHSNDSVANRVNYKFLYEGDTIIVRDNFYELDQIAWEKGAIYKINAFVIPYQDIIQYYVVDLNDITCTETDIVDVREHSVFMSSNAIYNLSGQRISRPQRGSIYIQNGKKILYNK